MHECGAIVKRLVEEKVSMFREKMGRLEIPENEDFCRSLMFAKLRFLHIVPDCKTSIQPFFAMHTKINESFDLSNFFRCFLTTKPN